MLTPTPDPHPNNGSGDLPLANILLWWEECVAIFRTWNECVAIFSNMEGMLFLLTWTECVRLFLVTWNNIWFYKGWSTISQLNTMLNAW